MSPQRPKRDLTKVEVSVGNAIEGPSGSWRCTAEIVDGSYRLEMSVHIADGEATCERLVIDRYAAMAEPGKQVGSTWQPPTFRHGRPITSGMLRTLPIAAYLDLVVERLDRFIRFDPERRTLRRPLIATSERPATIPQPGRRRAKEELLPQVVEEYRRALKDLDPRVRRRPTQAVADRLHYQRGHISRLLSEARGLGMLGPARRGRAGEDHSGEDA